MDIYGSEGKVPEKKGRGEMSHSERKKWGYERGTDLLGSSNHRKESRLDITALGALGEEGLPQITALGALGEEGLLQIV